MPRSLKQMARSGELAAGTFLVEFLTPGIGHILAGAGCDFAFLDMEHSGFSTETVKAALRFLEAGGIPTLVRVPSRDAHDIARIADMGAEGVMVSLVGTREVAQAAVDALKYPPEGKRGVALRVAHDNYRAPPTPAAGLAAANARTTLFLMIETAEGVENAEAIAALDGVDCLWVGHFDLSCSLGVPGQFDHPTFTDAIERVIEGARKHGKAVGRLVPDVQTGIDLYKQGFDFVCYSGDVWVLQAGVKAGIDAIRAGVEG